MRLLTSTPARLPRATVAVFGLLALAAPANVADSLVARPAAGQDAQSILARAAQRHRGLSSLRVSFVQEIDNPVLERRESSAGTFYYRAPLEYRIAFSKPPRDVVVSTGKDVWIYLPSSQPGQVIRSPVSEGAKGMAPFQFLYEFADRYEPSLTGIEPIGGRPSYHLVLEPRSDTADYEHVELWIDKETALTRQMEVRERNGVVRKFTLTDHRSDPDLSPALFSFRPPRGVEVFEQ